MRRFRAERRRRRAFAIDGRSNACTCVHRPMHEVGLFVRWPELVELVEIRVGAGADWNAERCQPRVREPTLAAEAVFLQRETTGRGRRRQPCAELMDEFVESRSPPCAGRCASSSGMRSCADCCCASVNTSSQSPRPSRTSVRKWASRSAPSRAFPDRERLPVRALPIPIAGSGRRTPVRAMRSGDRTSAVITGSGRRVLSFKRISWRMGVSAGTSTG